LPTTARATAKAVGAPVNRVLVSSTGVIGVPLNENLILDALPALAAGLSPHRFPDGPRAGV